jgi:hypothetical protein
MDFHEIWHLKVFQKAVEKFQASLISDKSNGYCTPRLLDNLIISCSFFLEWDIYPTQVVEQIKINMLCSITFFENRAVYEIVWENIVEPGRPQMPIWHMWIACWITKACARAHTHTQYVILIAFPLQQWLQEHASLLHCMFIACLIWLCIWYIP